MKMSHTNKFFLHTRKPRLFLVMRVAVILLLSSFLSGDAFSSPRQQRRKPAVPLLQRPMIHDETENDSMSSRRTLLSRLANAATLSSVALLFPAPEPAVASTTTPLETYQDNAFQFQVPKDWTATSQKLPDRRKLQLYIKPDSNQKTLVFVAYTPVRDDYTSLGSFGSVDDVAQATILPKQEIMGVKGVESNMLSSESKQNAYFFDYVQQVPNQPKTHFRTIFTLISGGTGGAGSVLVSITAQTPESEYETEFKPLFDQIINSYKPMK